MKTELQTAVEKKLELELAVEHIERRIAGIESDAFQRVTLKIDAVELVTKHAKLYSDIEPMLREMVELKENRHVTASEYFSQITVIITKIATRMGEK